MKARRSVNYLSQQIPHFSGQASTFRMCLALGVCIVWLAVPATAQDLLLTAVSNPPTAVATNGSFAVTDTTRNQGAAAAGASTTRYYVSEDTTYGWGDIGLTGSRQVDALGSSQESTGTVTVTLMPGTPMGPYYLVACADADQVVGETNESNNCRASATTVAVTGPDLVVSALSAPPSPVAPGSSFSVTSTTANTGPLPSVVSSTTRFYLSTDTTYGWGDYGLSPGSQAVPALAPDAAHPGTVTVTIPSSIPLGLYFLLACADADSQITEANETNNCRASATQAQVTRADLVVSALSDPPPTLARGSSVSVTDTTRNQGLLPATAASTTRYYLSTDTTSGWGDYGLMGSHPVPALGPGEDSTGPLTVTIPASTPLGLYYLLACADADAGVPESNETNNCRASTTQVQVTDNPVPVLTLLAPASALVGSPALTLTVTGTGFVATSVVRWNAAARPTTFLSSTQLQAAIPASDLTIPGSVSITVATPAPGGGTSNPLPFTIEAQAPVPTLTGIDPSQKIRRSRAFTMMLEGTGFRSNTQVWWNGAARTTEFVSESTLRAFIPASDMLAPGVATVAVFTPPPGGGLSNTRSFTIASPGAFEVLHSFGDQSSMDGSYPVTGLTAGTDGHFYGTTLLGGNGTGTIFKLDQNDSFSAVHRFQTNASDGLEPISDLVRNIDGALYGITHQGGAGGYGVVFRIDQSGTFSLLHSFGGPDGMIPRSPITVGDGSLYGVTVLGGGHSLGTLFKIDSNGSFSTIHTFSGPDGANPAAVIHARDGSLYGVTQAGGTTNGGVIFRYDLLARTIVTIYTFPVEVDYETHRRLLETSAGTVLVTTWENVAGVASISRLESNGTLTPLVPYLDWPSELIEGADGLFYGTTYGGGQGGQGTIFQMNAAGTMNVLHSFISAEGMGSFARLMQSTDGAFYGTTSRTMYDDAQANGGVVFRLRVQPTGLSVAAGPDREGLTTELRATLSSDEGPLAGKLITFTSGGATLGSAYTDEHGVAVVGLPAPLAGSPEATADVVSATYAGDDAFGGASATGPPVNRRP